MDVFSMISGQFLAVSEKFADTIESIVRSGIPEKTALTDLNDSESDHDFDVVDSIAIIEIKGSLSKNVSWWAQYFGRATSYSWLKEQVQFALDDPMVKTILLSFDSPGGSVDGVKEASDFLFNAAKNKPFYTYADGCMCSGAYWLGSVSKTIAAPATADIGSIGVRTLHIDWSDRNKKQGANITHLAAGRFKAIGNGDEPLNGSAKDYILGHLNQIYTIFTDDVARNRNIEKPDAEKMAEGRVFIGQEAMDIGLIDMLTESRETFINFIIEKEGLKHMDINEFKSNHGELYGQIVTDTKAAAAADMGNQISEAVSAETGRILDISTAVLGEEIAGKLAGVVKSGADANQVNALKDVLGVTSEPANSETTEEKESNTKAAILDGLKQAHSDGVNQKKGDQDKSDINAEADALVGLIQ